MDAIDLAFYRHQGHLTVNGVFAPAETDAVIADIEAWGESFLADLPAEQRAWYVDGGVQARTVLRKLDNPHAHRPAVQALARDPRLVALVEQFLGAGRVGLLQPDLLQAARGRRPEAGAPGQLLLRPDRHRRRRHGVDRARRRDARERLPLLRRGHEPGAGLRPRRAADEPFNLQLPASVLDKQPMAPAPVRKGGVSFHHGNTFHQSGPNHSSRWRRACALHYVRNGVEFATPALPYDHALKMRVS